MGPSGRQGWGPCEEWLEEKPFASVLALAPRCPSLPLLLPNPRHTHTHPVGCRGSSSVFPRFALMEPPVSCLANLVNPRAGFAWCISLLVCNKVPH